MTKFKEIPVNYSWLSESWQCANVMVARQDAPINYSLLNASWQIALVMVCREDAPIRFDLLEDDDISWVKDERKRRYGETY